MKKTVLLIVIAVLATFICSCQAFSAPADEEGDKTIVVGYIVQSFTNEYHVKMSTAVKEEAAKRGGFEILTADGLEDSSTQISQIEAFVSQGVDIIFVCPVDQVALEDPVAAAIAAGVPVICLDQEIKGSSVLYINDDYKYGYASGLSAGLWLNKKEADGTIQDILNKDGAIEVCVIRHDPLVSLIRRGDGMIAAMRETYTGGRELRIVMEQNSQTAEGGYAIAETALMQYPDCAVFLGIQDTAALGAYEGIQQFKQRTSDNTCVTGSDALPKALELIKKGDMYAGTVDIPSALFATNLLDIAEDVVAGGVYKDPVYFSVVSVNSTNISDYIPD